jgi:transcriptional regulator with PAS, ATPase and Fis domain
MLMSTQNHPLQDRNQKAGASSTASIKNLAAAPDPLDKILGTCPSIASLKEKLKRYAAVDAPVLLLGESGTGKELAAQCIHYHSRRKEHPYVVLNCAAIPDTLAEAEFFGSEKGAFTDAIFHLGKFEQAQGGTVFLDEIAETSPDTQVKLLRVLENKTFVRLGGSRELTADFRLVSATNENLRSHVKTRRFRHDLLYRINTLFLELPPLRKRQGDVEFLAKHFLNIFCGDEKKFFSPNALEQLLAHPWPGNIRELKSVIERAVCNCRGDRVMGPDIQIF